MSEARPTPIVRQLDELSGVLHTVILREVDAPLVVLEQAVLDAVRVAMAGLLGAVIRLSQRSLQPSGPQRQWPCPGCGERRGVQSWRPRMVTTVCGKVRLERPWCHCPRCGHGFSPTDASLALPPRTRLSSVSVSPARAVASLACSSARDSLPSNSKLGGWWLKARTGRDSSTASATG